MPIDPEFVVGKYASLRFVDPVGVGNDGIQIPEKEWHQHPEISQLGVVKT